MTITAPTRIPTRLPDGPTGHVCDEQLADDICTWAGRMAAGEATLLTLIAEFDRWEAWAGPGLRSCAHWLSWRIGLSPGAAREKVRTARALSGLPVVTEALQQGRVSYSQARAITRVAVAGDERRWVDLARSATAGQLERVVRGVARARAADERETDPEAVAHRLRSTRSYDADGNVVFRLVLPAEQAAVVDAALELVRRELEDAAPADPPEPAGVSAETSAPASSLTSAALAMAARTLDPGWSARPGAARRARATLTLHLDPVSGWGRLRDGELLPPSVVGLRRHDSGRSSREPSAALRRLVGTLDGERCRSPDCTRTRRLQAHHVMHWEHGGPTDLDNLVLLCSAHHQHVHRAAVRLELAPSRAMTVAACDGQPLPHHPTMPWRPAVELDPTGRVRPTTLPPDQVEARIDLDYAVAVLCQQAA